MTNKLGKMVTYREGLLPIKLRDALITMPCEITWQTKTIISPLSHYHSAFSHQTWQDADLLSAAPIYKVT